MALNTPTSTHNIMRNRMSLVVVTVLDCKSVVEILGSLPEEWKEREMGRERERGGSSTKGLTGLCVKLLQWEVNGVSVICSASNALTALTDGHGRQEYWHNAIRKHDLTLEPLGLEGPLQANEQPFWLQHSNSVINKYLVVFMKGNVRIRFVFYFI